MLMTPSIETHFQRPSGDYRIPFIAALLVHLSLLIVLIAHWPSDSPQHVGLNSNVQIISATVLSEATISTARPHAAIKSIKAPEPVPPKPAAPVKPAPEKQMPTKAQPAPKENPAIAKAQALKQQQAKLQLEKIKAEKAKQAKQKAEQQRVAAEQKKQKEQKQKALAESKALQQKLLQQQLASEQHQLQLAEQEQHQVQQLQGALDEYKSQIIAAISQYWVIPVEAKPSLYCRLLIHLAPTGVVLSVEMLHSSGDAGLDHSSRTAVLKASPLPVPKDAAVFDHFRELRLTFRPEGVVAG